MDADGNHVNLGWNGDDLNINNYWDGRAPKSTFNPQDLDRIAIICYTFRWLRTLFFEISRPRCHAAHGYLSEMLMICFGERKEKGG